MGSEPYDHGFPYTERREGILRLCLPCEDLDSGLYIHPLSARLLATLLHEREVETIEPVQVWVAAEDFMAVQKERDDLRRTVGLINSIRARDISADEALGIMADLCEASGFRFADAEVMASIIRQTGGWGR
jgi:hypothetical protein